MKKLVATPSQTVGPFYHFALDRPEWSDLTVGGVKGEKIRIEGRITDG
jgi:protocatechuate 3,4-dioxygenase alpha subunit